jgi:LPS-assembly protein
MPVVAALLRAAVVALLWATVAGAQAPGAPVAGPGTPAVVSTSGGDVGVVADRMEQVAPNLLIATGHVELTRGSSRILADRVEINRETGDTVATGHVIFYDGDNELAGERLDYNVKAGTGVVYDAQARAAPYYRIGGERMERLSENRYHIRRGVFTTCEADTPEWSVHLGDAEADLDDSLFGRNASLWLKDLPLIPWIPFFSTALRRERQTGFLFPQVGQSTRKGFFASQPFFWAISDSQDATVTVSDFSRRGPALNTEYRYVLSPTNRGIATGFAVYESQGKNTQGTQNDVRGWYGFKHDWTIAPGLTAKADINGVSDDNVLREYSDTLQQRSLQRVESNVFVSRAWEGWSFLANMFWYQDLTVQRSVELNRLPELRATAPRQPLPGVPGGLLYEFQGSATHFDRAAGSSGDRLDLHPRLSRPFSAAGFFTVTPFVGGRLTAYDRTVIGSEQTADVGLIELTDNDPRVRSLVEWGGDFEARAIRIYPVNGLGGWSALMHSIEPRVNFTQISGNNTTKLPIWTEQIDNIPESRRITYTLTNRVRGRTDSPPGTEPVRLELFRFLVGHSWDLTLKRAENLIADMVVQPSEVFSVRSDATHGVHGEGLIQADVDTVVVLPHLSASIGYRYSKQPRSLTPGSTVTPAGGSVNNVTVTGTPAGSPSTSVDFLQGAIAVDVSRLLTARFTTNVDLRTGTFVENRFGIDTRFQCYGFSIEYVRRTNNEDEVRFALNLLGMGSPLTTSAGLSGLGAGAR